MAIRSYLASLSGQGDPGGQGGVTGGPGGVQTMLANLRNQLYGPQALQAVGGTPAAGKPAWQQLREAGIGGQGSPAANRAALAGLQGGGPIGTGPGIQTMEARLTPDQVPQVVRDAMAGRQNVTGGGLMAPTGTAVDPGFVGTNVNPQATMDYWTPERMASAQPMSSVYDPQGGGAQAAQPLPATMTAPVLPTAKPGAAGGTQGATGPTATPIKPSMTAAGPSASPAVLGTQEFRGPNARRITQARSSIYNNVRNALRKPAGGQ